jgi:hypothetical protein
MDSNANPSVVADAPTCSLTAGTRTTQVANIEPSTVNKIVNGKSRVTGPRLAARLRGTDCLLGGARTGGSV